MLPLLGLATSFLGAVGGGKKGGVLGTGIGGKAKVRRRRRARLTQSELMELTNIKNILGRTAAANALPYYLGRR